MKRTLTPHSRRWPLAAMILIALVAVVPTLALAGSVDHGPYRPFLDPIVTGRWWWFLMLPLVVGISVVYKAIRLPTLNHYWGQVVKMIAQIMAAMVVMAVGLYVIVQMVLPMM